MSLASSLRPARFLPTFRFSRVSNYIYSPRLHQQLGQSNSGLNVMPSQKRKATSRVSPTSKRTKSTQATTANQTTSSKPGMSESPQSPFTSYPPSKVYRLIEPGPVVLVSTGPPPAARGKSKPTRSAAAEEDGSGGSDINLMTMGFHMMVQHSGPPLIAACIGPWDATYARLRAARQCVLAIPSAEMASTVVDIGNCSADDLDASEAGEGGEANNKFDQFGLAPLPARKVRAPLVGGEHVIANIECVVEDDKLVGKYNLWVLKVVAAWVNGEKMPDPGRKGAGRMMHHRGDGTFVVDGEKEVLDLRERMVKWRMFQD